MDKKNIVEKAISSSLCAFKLDAKKIQGEFMKNAILFVVLLVLFFSCSSTDDDFNNLLNKMGLKLEIPANFINVPKVIQKEPVTDFFMIVKSAELWS